MDVLHEDMDNLQLDLQTVYIPNCNELGLNRLG